MDNTNIGMQHTSKVLVSGNNTARAMGSGELPVFATPEMVALMENAAMMAVSKALDNDCTTVGASINISHLSPSSIGTTIIATAILTKVEGRKLTFHVEAKDGSNLIGEGEHVRYIVNIEKFMEKANK